MKNSLMIKISALAAALILTGCGDIGEAENDNSTAQTTETAAAASVSEETASESRNESSAADGSPSETDSSSDDPDSNTASAADNSADVPDTSSAAEEDPQGPMDGTGGHAEDSLYKLYGWWESAMNDDYIHIYDGSFDACINGVSANGNLKYEDKDGVDCFVLVADSADFPAGTYVFGIREAPGKMRYYNGSSLEEYIYRGDLEAKLLKADTEANGYDGEPLSFPLTIELTAKEEVRDVAILKLEYNGFDEARGSLYTYTEQLTLPLLERGKSITPTIEIPEVIPKYGVRYTDQHGTVHFFDISQSGKDGSIILSPFFEQE